MSITKLLCAVGALALAACQDPSTAPVTADAEAKKVEALLAAPWSGLVLDQWNAVDPYDSRSDKISSDYGLAQVVTARVSGFLVRVELPIFCASGASLLVQIRGVTSSGIPSGTSLTSATVPAANLSADQLDWESITLSSPPYFQAGMRFAIVLRSLDSTCQIRRARVGDTYLRGSAYFFNEGGFTRVGAELWNRDDLPFRTLVRRFP